MVSSVLSAFKEVVHILLDTSVNYQFLHHVTENGIVGLENIGLKDISVVTDNSINGRSMSLFLEPRKKSFVYSHSIDPEKPFFFFFYCFSAHFQKYLELAESKKKNDGKCFFYLNFDKSENSDFKVPSLLALKKMYEKGNKQNNYIFEKTNIGKSCSY